MNVFKDFYEVDELMVEDESGQSMLILLLEQLR